MRRMLIWAAVAAASAGAMAGAAAGSVGRAKLELRKTSKGMILVNSRGFTIYAFSRDRRNRDNCARIKHCPAAWPLVTTGGKPIAGRGVRPGLIGTIKLAGGTKQVTYNGHPLYTYAGDSAPAQTFYINFFQFGGYWPGLNAAGKEVR